MKKIFTHILAVVLIVSSLSLPKVASAATPIGTLGTVPSLTVAGRVFTDLTNLITLSCYAASTHRCTFRKIGATVGYQVTTGKTLTIYALQVNNVASSASLISPAQSDNDLGFDSASTLTNPIYATSVNGLMYSTSGTGPQTTSPLNFGVAGTKYFSLDNIGTGAGLTALAFGYEQ